MESDAEDPGFSLGATVDELRMQQVGGWVGGVWVGVSILPGLTTPLFIVHIQSTIRRRSRA